MDPNLGFRDNDDLGFDFKMDDLPIFNDIQIDDLPIFDNIQMDDLPTFSRSNSKDNQKSRSNSKDNQKSRSNSKDNPRSNSKDNPRSNSKDKTRSNSTDNQKSRSNSKDNQKSRSNSKDNVISTIYNGDDSFFSGDNSYQQDDFFRVNDNNNQGNNLNQDDLTLFSYNHSLVADNQKGKKKKKKNNKNSLSDESEYAVTKEPRLFKTKDLRNSLKMIKSKREKLEDWKPEKHDKRIYEPNIEHMKQFMAYELVSHIVNIVDYPYMLAKPSL